MSKPLIDEVRQCVLTNLLKAVIFSEFTFTDVKKNKGYLYFSRKRDGRTCVAKYKESLFIRLDEIIKQLEMFGFKDVVITPYVSSPDSWGGTKGGFGFKVDTKTIQSSHTLSELVDYIEDVSQAIEFNKLKKRNDSLVRKRQELTSEIESINSECAKIEARLNSLTSQ